MIDAPIGLAVLGRFEITRDGERISPSGRNGQLLSLLALHLGRAVPDHQVFEALWGDDPPDRAASTLRTYVTRLRQRIGSDLIERTSHGYRLLIDPAEADFIDFEQRLLSGRAELEAGRSGEAGAELERALDRWGGDPWAMLAGWPAADADATRLRELKAQCEDLLAQCLLLAGRTDEAVARLRPLVELEPFRERRLALLMHGLVTAGRKQDAVRVCARARDASIELTGLDLSDTITGLERRVLDDDPLADVIAVTGAEVGRSAAAATATTPLSETTVPDVLPVTMIGRDEELALLADVGSPDRAGGPRMSIVLGEAGIGKSHLLRATGRALAGVRFHVGRCFESETPGQYRAVASIMRSLIGDGADLLPPIVRADLATLLPELGDDRPAELSDDRRLRMHDAATWVVADRAEAGPLVIALDDTHWADRASLELLGHLLAHCESSDLHLIVALRGEEVEPGGFLDEWLRDVQRVRPTQEVRLDGLGRTDVGSLVADSTDLSALPAGRAEEVVTAIHRLSDGNPFFVLELIQHWLAAGSSDDQPAGRLDEGEIPRGVLAVLGRRLSRLDNPSLVTLQAVAASPDGIDFDLLSSTVDDQVDDLVTTVEQLVAAGLLVEVPDRGDVRYECRHALVRRATVDDMSAARLTVLHHRIAAAGDRLDPTTADPRLPTVAYHWWAAGRRGRPDRALACNRAAADEAMSRTAFEAAAAHLDYALDALDWLGATVEERAVIMLDRARAHHGAGRQDDRRLDAATAFELARTVDDERTMIDAALIHGGARSTYGITNHETMALLQEALDRLDSIDRLDRNAAEDDAADELAQRALVLARLAQEVYHTNAFEQARDLSAEAERLTERMTDDRMVANVFHGRVWTLNHPDHLDTRVRLIDEMVPRAETTTDRELEMVARTWRAAASIERGDVEALDLDIEALVRLSSDVRIPSHLIRVATLRTTRAMMQGDYALGMALADEAYRAGLQTEPENAEQVFNAQMIAPFRDQGLLAGALPMVDEIMGRFGDVPGWRCAQAYVYAEAGEHAAAADMISRLAADGFRSIPRDMAWMQAHAYLADASATIGDARAAALVHELLLPYEERNIGLWDINSGGAVAGYLGVTALAAGETEAAARHLSDAIEFNRRTGQTSPLLWSQLALARVRGQQGDAEAAKRLGDEVTERSTGLGWAGLAAAAASRPTDPTPTRR